MGTDLDSREPIQRVSRERMCRRVTGRNGTGNDHCVGSSQGPK